MASEAPSHSDAIPADHIVDEDLEGKQPLSQELLGYASLAAAVILVVVGVFLMLGTSHS